MKRISNRKLWQLQLSGIQNMTCHDVPAAHAYKAVKLKQEVQKAVEALSAEARKLMDEVGITDMDADRKRLTDLKDRRSSLTEQELKEYDTLSDKIKRYEELESALMDEEVEINVKTMPYDVWHALQRENAKRSIRIGGKVLYDVDLLTELENTLEGILWVAPEENDEP